MNDKTQIQNQLDQLQGRHASLSKQRGDVLLALSEAHAALVEGTGHARAVSLAQNDRNTLNDAIDEVDGQIAQTRAALARIEAEEEKERRIESAFDMAREAQTVFEGHQIEFLDLCREVAAGVDKMMAARERLGVLQREFAPLDAALQLATIAKERGLDLDFSALKIDWRFYKFPGRDEMPGAVWGIENSLSFALNQANNRPSVIPDALSRSSFPVPGLDVTFRDVSPRDTERGSTAPTRIRQEDIGR